jgi:hypothetical protein
MFPTHKLEISLTITIIWSLISRLFIDTYESLKNIENLSEKQFNDLDMDFSVMFKDTITNLTTTRNIIPEYDLIDILNYMNKLFNIASSHQIFQSVNFYAYFLLKFFYILKNLMETCNNESFFCL